VRAVASNTRGRPVGLDRDLGLGREAASERGEPRARQCESAPFLDHRRDRELDGVVEHIGGDLHTGAVKGKVDSLERLIFFDAPVISEQRGKR
jgi:hypothetical protein